MAIKITTMGIPTPSPIFAAVGRPLEPLPEFDEDAAVAEIRLPVPDAVALGIEKLLYDVPRTVSTVKCY